MADFAPSGSHSAADIGIFNSYPKDQRDQYDDQRVHLDCCGVSVERSLKKLLRLSPGTITSAGVSAAILPEILYST